MIWLFTMTAMAADPVKTVDGWLLSDKQYDNCIVAAQNLPLCQEALDTAVPKCVSKLEELAPKLTACADALVRDQERDDELTQKILQAAELRSADKLLIQKLRAQRNTSYLVIGGTIVTAALVGGAAIAL